MAKTTRSGALGSLGGILVATTTLILPATLKADPPGEEDHEELRAMLAIITEAINEGNFDAVEPLLAEPFAYTTSDQVTLSTVAEINGHYDKIFKSGDYPVRSLAIEAEPSIKTQFVDDTNGFVYGTANETYTLASGKQIEFTCHWTGTVTKVDGRWKLSTAHSGINFYDNPIVEALGASAKWSLIVGAIAGIIVGFLFSMLLGRRKRNAAASPAG